MKKKRSTFRRKSRHGLTNTTSLAMRAFREWGEKYGGKHPPITRVRVPLAMEQS